MKRGVIRMRGRNERKRILVEIMKDLEIYLRTQDYKTLNDANNKYFSYLNEGGKKTFEEIERCAFREYAIGNAW